MTPRLDPTRRFSGRVDSYEHARPGYPSALYEELLAQLPPAMSAIAELDSGTGIFSRELRRQGYRVFGAEPNRRMRVTEFFPERPLHRAAFENHQILDRESFGERILSASYMPAIGPC